MTRPVPAPHSSFRQRGVFIAIEGPTGVGKTTLARHLAPFADAEVLADPFEANSFLLRQLGGDESLDTRLACELSFIALRAAVLRDVSMRLASGANVVADWALCKQSVFAAVNLEADDAERVRQTCQIWETGLPDPDLLIGLSAPVHVLQARIRRRARPRESTITESELAALLSGFEHAYAACTSPVLRLDAEAFNAFDPTDLRRLYERIRQQIGVLHHG